MLKAYQDFLPCEATQEQKDLTSLDDKRENYYEGRKWYDQ
jgi:hypothetical protein